MSLLDVRKHFIEFTGRFDLVTDPDSFRNNGADWYIQQGQRWLDRQFTMGSSFARNYQRVPHGQWWALIPECRAIQEVWFSNSIGRKWQVQKAGPEDIARIRRKDPALISPTSLQQIVGVNVWRIWQRYTPVYLRTVPEKFKDLTIDVFFSTIYEDGLKSHYDFNGLIFMPPSVEDLELEVHGLFYQPKLERDLDSNVWSEKHEFALVVAAARHLEVTYRNTAGVNDYTAEVMSQLTPIEFDFIEEEISEVTEMRG